MRPCDCVSQVDFERLNEQSIAFNEWSITPHSYRVDIRGPHFRVSIPKGQFTRFARWYLTEQAQQGSSSVRYSVCQTAE